MRKTRALFALLLIVVLICGTALCETYYARQIKNCNSYVTLRSKASASSKAVCTVPIGDVVMARSHNSEFSYCCYSGKFGYIKTEYLSSQIDPWSEGSFRIANCKSYVTLRSMPISDSDERAQIPLGTVLDEIIYGDDTYNPNAFAYVHYNGQWGFVKWKYLEYISVEGVQ